MDKTSNFQLGNMKKARHVGHHHNEFKCSRNFVQGFERHEVLAQPMLFHPEISFRKYCVCRT